MCIESEGYMMKYIGYVFVFVGIFAILGTAGADCDGKCMENAMTIGETLMWSLAGIGATAVGALLIMKG
jgi:hypothetical protein